MIILHPYYFTLIIFIRDIYLSPCDAKIIIIKNRLRMENKEMLMKEIY
jgi:hypothetical protein